MNLLKIQSELKAPKSQFNSFGKYKYRNCEDILEAVKPLLLKYDCTMTITDEVTEVGGRVYVKAIVTLQDGDNVHQVSAYAREDENKKGMDLSQLTGATSSYARKYALNGMFLIDDTKDSDTTNQHGSSGEAKQNGQPKAKQNGKEELTPDHPKWAEAKKALQSNNVTIETLKKHFTLTDTNEKTLSS